MILNSLICKLINVQASMKENKEKKIKTRIQIENQLLSEFFLLVSPLGII